MVWTSRSVKPVCRMLTTGYGYDERGNLTTLTDAKGNTLSLTYIDQVQGPFTFQVVSRIDAPDSTVRLDEG